MKVFLDTNVWLRFLVGDHPTQYSECEELFQKVEVGQLRPYTSSIVLLEIYFVLTSYYEVKSSQVISDLETILQTRNLTLIEKTNFQKGLNLHQQTQVKLADCLIFTQVVKDTYFCTYDQEFQKLVQTNPDLKVVTPAKINRMFY